MFSIFDRLISYLTHQASYNLESEPDSYAVSSLLTCAIPFRTLHAIVSSLKTVNLIHPADKTF